MVELTIGDYLSGIRDTRDALKRADQMLARLTEAAVKRPSAGTTALAESTMRLRAVLAEELGELEKGLAEAEE